MPGWNALTDGEREIVRQCLDASVNGPFFDDDDEFHTLFGLTRSEVARVARDWPGLDDAAPNVSRAINNAMNNLLGYPHGRENAWGAFVHVSPAEVARVFVKWRGADTDSFGGLA